MALKDLSVKLGLNSLGFQAGLQNAGKCLSGFKGQVNSTNSGVASGTSALAGFAKSAFTVTAVMAALTTGIKAANTAFKAFVSLESSALRTADIFGESLKYVKYFAENTAKAFGMSESAAYQYAATYGNLFRAITKDSAENAKVTIAMLKASAVVASKTGRTVEDVMERIRSGLLGNTEAIEDLGIYATVGATTATAAFRQIANGRSWEQLTYYEQQQVRTLSILEQAHTRFGDTVQQSSAFSLQTLSGAFKNLISYAGAFVNAGLQPVIKGLTQLVYWASAGVKALAALFGVDLSSALESKKNTELATAAQDGLTDAVNKTAKAKQRLAGFDQINTLAAKDDSSSGSSSGSAGGVSGGVFDNIATPELDIDTSKLDAKLEMLKEKFDFTNLKKALKELGVAFEPLSGTIGEGLSWIWKNVLEPLVSINIKYTMPEYLNLLADAFVGLDLILKPVKTVWDWLDKHFFSKIREKMDTPLGNKFQESFGKAIAIITLGLNPIGHLILVLSGIKKAADFASNAFTQIKTKAAELFTALKIKVANWWKDDVKPWFTKEKWMSLLFEVGASAGRAIVAFRDFFKVKLPAWWKDDVKPWFTKEKWSGIYNNMKTAISAKWEEIKTTVSAKLKSFWNDTVKPWFTVKKWKDLGTNIKDGIVSGFKSAVTSVVNFINGIISAFEKGVNAVLGGVRSLLSGYNSVPGLDDVDLSPYQDKHFKRVPAPHFATGGIVTSPTYALVGEAGAEAVMPLENNTGWINQLADKINARGGSGGGDIYLTEKIYLDDGTLIDTVVKRIKRDSRRINKPILGV